MQMYKTKMLIKQQVLVYKFTMAMEQAKFNLNRVVLSKSFKFTAIDNEVHVTNIKDKSVYLWTKSAFQIIWMLADVFLFYIVGYACKDI